MKKVFKFVGFVSFIGIFYVGLITYPKLDLISGFSAKSIASGHFIDNRSQKMIEKGDNDIDMIDLAKNKIEATGKFAIASVYGLKERKAIYREGLGATLINDDFDVSKPYLVPKRTRLNINMPFPYGNNEPKDTVFSDVDYTKLNAAVANAFDEKEAIKKRTRSLLVIYKDKIIAEKYDSGFDKNSKILGWSMTKSITSAMFGILEIQGKYDIYKPAPIPEWKNDDRKSITTNDLLHMNSGLEWEEQYDKISDATKMLFQAEDMTLVQRKKSMVFRTNTHWNYSSGTTNLLSGILRKQFKTHQEYLDFWYSALIDKIGMYSMVIETDMAGNYVGSSYGWATTRDWSKFGLLYLHKGNWNGEQIFNESWAKYTATPTNTSNGRYGGHFWLNAGGHFPDVPRDMYYCSGFQGQMVAIIPSLDLVIVRMGLKENPNFDFNGMLRGIVESVKK
ncbi:class C beta-lactamase-related serine hydrolase [Flavobacterium bomense]|uniref:Class C beta-lactamase-related serine hydrolase n=1 Tax=Flavobacterium bomense TaxID=2497483 RepID=A0A3S0MKD3_9FLAO|nr:MULTISPECIES: serine hydrolase [Flavobacterium]RTY70306.1 class C beta-lactamase-related serine hydrolase [Flavobacterium sp. LB2P53]RTY92701.1 class C beta-lactamase-related serine hydrolase [Flavobacterium sp. RSP46]RTZ07965.1 class C beta-lactamase-related serine hydrolase [Flavobacterium bomense]